MTNYNQKVVAVAYERFQQYGFAWEKFGVLDRWSLMGGCRTWRFDLSCQGTGVSVLNSDAT